MPQNVRSFSLVGKVVDQEKRINSTCGHGASMASRASFALWHVGHSASKGRSDWRTNCEKARCTHCVRRMVSAMAEGCAGSAASFCVMKA